MDGLTKALTTLDQLEIDQVETAKARALITGYHHRYQNDEWSCLDAEVPVIFEIPYTDLTYVGMIDTLVSGYGKQRVMIEHKTIGRDLKEYDAFTGRLPFESQISRYHLASLLKDEPIDQTIYDVIRKITIKPSRIAKGKENSIGTLWEIENEGTYYGFDVPDLPEDLERETAKLFEFRCTHDVLERPEKYYHRFGHITRSSHELRDTLIQLIDIAKDIESCKTRGRWYQNTEACERFGSPGEFLNLCRNTESIDDEVWGSRTGGSVSGQDRLSHSGIGCFLTCRRKYFYRYVQRIERRVEKSNALIFGSAIHQSLEAWWMAKRKDKKDDGNQKDTGQ